MDERELKKEYVTYLRDNKLEHLDCEMLFEMIKYFEGLGKNKYDEALERAKEIKSKILSSHLSTESCKAVSEYIDTIIPELRESEDERIRKMCITAVNIAASADGGLLHHEAKQCLDWLEKQKDINCLACDQYLKGYLVGRKVTEEEKQNEQKPKVATATLDSEKQKEPHYTKRNALFDKCVENCDPATMKRVSDEVDEMLQKEQKPVEIHIDNPNIEKFDPDVKVTTSDSSASGKELLYVCNKSYKIGYRDGVASVKPAEWSEEDENSLEYLHEIIDFGVTEKFFDAQTAADMREWLNTMLKSLKPQPKQEWSEEDKRILKGIIGLIDHNQHYNVSNKEMLEWLKSLRPQGSKDSLQTHWKPSEEQMDVLLNTEGMIRASGYPENAKVLASLYEALKKL